MELIEPDVRSKRGSFHGAYIVPKAARRKDATWPRLLDCLRCIAGHEDPDYFSDPESGEFAVVDVVTMEKAWFEMPHGCTPAIVGSMVEGCFGSRAFRVAPKLWFV